MAILPSTSIYEVNRTMMVYDVHTNLLSTGQRSWLLSPYLPYIFDLRQEIKENIKKKIYST